jgi:hypothetical protein
LLHCIPITPLIRNETGVGTPEQRKELRRRWQAGQDLLDQMARATGGRSFVRVPGRYDFLQIYHDIVGKVGSVSEPRVDTEGRYHLNALHKAVMFVGPALRGVVLPTGERLEFPTRPRTR